MCGYPQRVDICFALSLSLWSQSRRYALSVDKEAISAERHRELGVVQHRLQLFLDSGGFADVIRILYRVELTLHQTRARLSATGLVAFAWRKTRMRLSSRRSVIVSRQPSVLPSSTIMMSKCRYVWFSMLKTDGRRYSPAL